jgi:predicted nucleic acid-binding protein
LLAQFQVLEDSPAMLAHWLRLVAKYDVKGRKTFDAWLVAVMLTHGVDRLLTFDTGDFKTYTEITLVHPSTVK